MILLLACVVFCVVADAERAGGFYSRHEFDISALLSYRGEIAELGRFCIAESYRSTKAVPRLLWCGLAEYIAHYHIDVLFGSAIFSGDDPSIHARALNWLWQHHRAPPDLRMVALPKDRVDRESLAVGLKNDSNSDEKDVFIPPLMKAYLRFGCYVSDGATFEKTFNCINIGIVLRGMAFARRYLLKERYLFRSQA